MQNRTGFMSNSSNKKVNLPKAAELLLLLNTHSSSRWKRRRRDGGRRREGEGRQGGRREF